MAELPQSVIWVGSQEVQEQPNSPKWEFTSGRTTCQRTFQGPYTAVLASVPNPGTTMNGFANTLIVEKVTVESMPGTVGQMVVQLGQEVVGFTTTAPATPAKRYEVEWVAVNRKLEQHPRYQSTATGALANGANQLAYTDLAALELWRNEPDYTLKIAYQFKAPITLTVTTLSTNAQHIAKKILRGQDSYETYAPVVRITSFLYKPAATSNVGQRGAPPGFPNLPVRPDNVAYVWLKTADRSTLSGRGQKWEQTEEWTGADYIDADIYP